MTIISSKDFTAKVSTVLGRDVKAYGKQYMFDDCEDTCWNSDQGKPQWIELNFVHPMVVTGFVIQFQGGFAAKSIHLQVKGETDEVFYPLDVNSLQEFSLPKPLSETAQLKLHFPDSTDTYGRIIVYKLVIFQLNGL